MLLSSSRSPRSLREGWPALLGLSAVFLVEMLDNSILTVALPTIGRELDASTAALGWVTGSYAVVFGGLMLLFGAVADRFGRRRIMRAGLTLLTIASLATGVVASTGELIAVRVLMGVAAAMTALNSGPCRESVSVATTRRALARRSPSSVPVSVRGTDSTAISASRSVTTAVTVPQRRYTVVLPTSARRARSLRSRWAKPCSASTSPAARRTAARTRAVRPPGRSMRLMVPQFR